MLVQFSVSNYKSFKEKMTFSMVGAVNKEHDMHIYDKGKLQVLKTSVIYGANASGKSNLIKAIMFMKSFVLNSSKELQAQDIIQLEPFLLDSQTAKQPSEFEVAFYVGAILYRYGFCADTRKVHREWLYYKKDIKGAKEIPLFLREADTLKTHNGFKEAKSRIIKILRPNALLLSVLAQFNGEISLQIYNWFLKLHVLTRGEFDPSLTTKLIKQNKVPQEWVKDFIIKSDMAISGFNINDVEFDLDKVPSFFKGMFEEISDKGQINAYNIQTEHLYYDALENRFKSVMFDLQNDESSGTKKFFSLAGMLYIAIINQDLLVIDEIDTSLHSALTRIIIELFQSPETNPGQAQLIFTTHDTCHLDKDRFRRDEIWFTEKDSHYATDLYSLIEYKNPTRKDASIRKDYIRGKYGALPFVNFEDFVDLFKKVKSPAK